MGATAFGWVSVSHAQAPVHLEVLGQLAVHTEVERLNQGTYRVRGRLSDELGKPVAGEIGVESVGGQSESVFACPEDGQEALSDGLGEPPPESVSVPPGGEFCLVVGSESRLVLVAQAEHFVQARHDIEANATRRLTRPSFRKAPATLDLFRKESHVAEVLAGSDIEPPPDARLSLGLRCQGEVVPIDQVPILGSQLIRFEWHDIEGAQPSTCQLVAEASAHGHLPLRATRSVLIRDRVNLEVIEVESQKTAIYLKVSARGTQVLDPSLSEGLVEARLRGAFLALSPVKNGTALLELKPDYAEQSVSLIYVPAAPSWMPGEPLSVTLPRGARGFRWAGVHTLGLLLFSAWLGYAWLRPAPRKEGRSNPPPRKAVLQESGKRTGPISGEVRDAHTGLPLAQVELMLLTIGIESSDALESTSSDEQGRFQFKTHLESHSMLRVVVTGEGYMTLTSTPRAVHLTIFLTERRRALVQNLVTWARALGPPWYRKAAPTPGTIAAVARDLGRVDAEQWADNVTEAAYRPTPPSEEEVLALQEPGSARGGT